jgi:asparagine synthase (glutamine-hydrolysing)
MCGICGFAGMQDAELLERMTDSLFHRGPDAGGTFHQDEVGLGHRRLSIIDLAGGQQPMATPDGQLVIVFNGEIYNYRELRKDLEADGVRFRTESDTEVLLRVFERHGTDAFAKLNGMFALAVWDRRRRELTLARDRVGIKPLSFVEHAGRLYFGSETKALAFAREWPRTLNAHAIHDYLGLRYVPGEVGMFREVKRLKPGHWLRWRAGRIDTGAYWTPPVYEGPYARSEDEYLEELEAILEASVRRRLMSDVALGAYLSGGLDSSVIVALMSKLGTGPVKTFSVGFDYEHDELSDAAATAKFLGCDHHEVECRAEDVLLLPEIVHHSDEPLGDAIAIPMYKLAREAKKQVTVILTGEGADEIFGGYLFHKVMWAADLYRRLTPEPIRRLVIEPLVGFTPAPLMNLAFRYPAYLGDRGKKKAVDYLALIGSGDLDEGYRHLISLFDERDLAPLYTDHFREELTRQRRLWEPSVDHQGSRFDQLLRLQFGHWLPDNMLLRNDKMSMASAIEGRVPYLDHELIGFAFKLPRHLRLRRLVGKYALRRLAERVLPRETAHRRKMPFYVPIENYFQQPRFVEMIDDLLGEDSVRRRGLFRPAAVEELRESMRRKDFLLVKQVFSLMTLELWFREFVDGSGATVVGAGR